MPNTGARDKREATLQWWDRVAALDSTQCAEYMDKLVEVNLAPCDWPLDEGVRLIQARAAYDTRFFAQVFMAETFTDPMTSQHDKYWKMVDDDRIPYTLFLAWRTFGKSTGLITKIIKDICYRKQSFIMWVGSTESSAIAQTEIIKTELFLNPKIRYTFQLGKATNYEGIDLFFSKKSWFACDPDGTPVAFVTPKGAGQKVRGITVRINGRIQRPTLICVDDVEEDEEIENEVNRKKVRKWFHGALKPCVNTRKRPEANNMWKLNPGESPPWRIIYADTLKHDDALVAHLQSDSSWRTAVFPRAELRTEPDGEREYYSLVPEILTDTQVRAEINEARKNNTMDVYSREYLCVPCPPELAEWTREDFQYYDETKESINLSDKYQRFLVVDPARTEHAKSALTAILAVGVNLVTGAVMFRRQRAEHYSVEEMLDAVLDMAVTMNSRLVCVEKTGADDLLKYLFKNRAVSRGIHVDFLWLEGRGLSTEGFGTGKEAVKKARAALLVPLYKKGYDGIRTIWHDNSMRDGPLELGLVRYPACKGAWDVIDTAAYVPKILGELGLYTPQKVEHAHDWLGDAAHADMTNRIASGDWRRY